MSKQVKLKVGDTAPAWSGVVTHVRGEQSVSSASLRGEAYILYFYPKDNTPGCTMQACDLRDQDLAKRGYRVIGCSPDSPDSHHAFQEKHGLPFELLSDTEHEVATLFGAWREKHNYGRTYMGMARSTFVINAEGVITQIMEDVKPKGHVAQLIKGLDVADPVEYPADEPADEPAEELADEPAEELVDEPEKALADEPDSVPPPSDKELERGYQSLLSAMANHLRECEVEDSWYSDEMMHTLLNVVTHHLATELFERRGALIPNLISMQRSGGHIHADLDESFKLKASNTDTAKLKSLLYAEDLSVVRSGEDLFDQLINTETQLNAMIDFSYVQSSDELHQQLKHATHSKPVLLCMLKKIAELGLGDRITSVNLSQSGLSEVPGWINQLTNINELDLSNNSITSVDVNLKSLRTLKLHNNPLDELELHLHDSPINHLEFDFRSVEALSQIIKRYPKIETLIAVDDEVSDYFLELLPELSPSPEPLTVGDLDDEVEEELKSEKGLTHIQFLVSEGGCEHSVSLDKIGNHMLRGGEGVMIDVWTTIDGRKVYLSPRELQFCEVDYVQYTNSGNCIDSSVYGHVYFRTNEELESEFNDLADQWKS